MCHRQLKGTRRSIEYPQTNVMLMICTIYCVGTKVYLRRQIIESLKLGDLHFYLTSAEEMELS